MSTHTIALITMCSSLSILASNVALVWFAFRGTQKATEIAEDIHE